MNGDDATDYEKKMYKKIQKLEDSAISQIKTMIQSSNKAYEDETEENQAYADYVYSLLSDHKVLVSSSIDTDNATYKNWKNGKISLNAFLKYAVQSGVD